MDRRAYQSLRHEYRVLARHGHIQRPAVDNLVRALTRATCPENVAFLLVSVGVYGRINQNPCLVPWDFRTCEHAARIAREAREIDRKSVV